MKFVYLFFYISWIQVLSAIVGISWKNNINGDLSPREESMVKKSAYSEKKFEIVNFPGEPENIHIEKELITPVYLFLDTSILPLIPRKPNIHFSRIRKMSKLGLIKIFLSVVAFKEWESRLQDEWEKDTNQINEGIELIKKHNWLSRDYLPSKAGRAVAGHAK